MNFQKSYFSFLSKLFFLLLIFQESHAIILDEAVEIAKNNSRAIKMHDYKLKATETLKTEALGEFLPSVKASAQYGSRKTNYSLSKSGHYETKELEVEQPLFSGFKSVSKYKEADYKVKSATSDNKNKKQEIVLAAITAYCDLFRYREIFRLQKESKDLADKFFALARRRGDARVIDEAEVIKFRYESSNAETRYFEASNKLAKAEFEYRNIVGELHQNLHKPSVKEEHFDEKNLIETAMENNHNLKSYHFNYLASKAAYNAEISSLSPTVSLVGSISEQRNAFYYSGQDYRNKSAYVNVSVPIFQKGVEYSNIIKAGHEKSAAREELEVTRESLIKELSQAIEEYNFYRKLNSSNKKLAELAKNRAAIFNKRFNAGVEDPLDHLRTKIELNDRKTDLINSEMDLVIAYHKVKSYLGEIW